MAISNLLPAQGANDNRPNLKQFFGKNPAVANDNVERVSSGMFSNTFVDSIMTTLTSLIDEIAKITDIARSVVASFGAIIKSIKGLNKEVTNRFRVLNNEINANKIDFIRSVLAVPKMEGAPRIEGAPVNVNAPAEMPAKEKGGFDFGDLLAGWLGMKAGGTALNLIKNGLLAFLNPATLLTLIAVGGAAWLLFQLKDLYNNLINSEEFKQWSDAFKNKTEVEMRQMVANEFRDRNDAAGRSARTQKRQDIDKSGIKLPDGMTLDHSMVMGKGSNEKGEEIWFIKDGSGFLTNKENIAAKVGFAAVNIDTGQTYSDIKNRTVGHFDGTPGMILPGFPVKQQAAPPPAASPAMPQMAPPAALGATGAGGFGLGGVTGMPAAPAGAPSAAPAGAPAGEVKPESNMQAAPPSGRPSLKGAVASAIPVPPAGPSGGGTGAGGGVAVVKNSSVQNVGSVGGAETAGMSGQNLPMFARNDKLQGIFGRQVLQEHQ